MGLQLLTCIMLLAGAHAFPAGRMEPGDDSLSQLTHKYVSRLRRVMRETCNCTQSQPQPTTIQPTPVPQPTVGNEIAQALASSSLVGGRMFQFGGSQRLVMALKNDEYVGALLLSGQMFESPVLIEMLRHVKPGSTVVEAGANFGAYTVFLAEKAGSNGRVVAFEPQNLVHQVLGANMLFNGLYQVQTINGAAYFRDGYVRMMSKVPDGKSEGKDYKALTMRQDRLNYGGMALGSDGEQVAARTIDSMMLDNVSLMKFDIQGAEAVAIYGARETIKRCKPVIAMEWVAENVKKFMDEHSKSVVMPQEVKDFDPIKFLEGLGYTMAKKMNVWDYFWHPPGYAA